MTCWLYQTDDDRVAHAYPDDDSITVAACGHKLHDDRCETCGHEVYTNEAKEWMPKCSACSKALGA